MSDDNLPNKTSSVKEIENSVKREKDFTPDDLSKLIKKLDKKDSSYLRAFLTKRSIKKVNRKIFLTRMVAAAMVFVFITIGIIYMVGYTYLNYGYGLSIVSSSVEGKRITLSEQSTFDTLSVGLRALPVRDMDNTTYAWLPEYTEIDTHPGGSNNGDNYMAYTFYILNVGGQDLEYERNISILSSTRGIETAIRIMLIKDGSPTVFTYNFVDEPYPYSIVDYDGIGIDTYIEGQGIEVKEFESPRVVEKHTDFLARGEHHRYSVVVWLEGEDPDTTDDKLSGELRLGIRFSVIE